MPTAKKSNLKNSQSPPEPEIKKILDLDDEVVLPVEKAAIVDDDEIPEGGAPTEDADEEEATLDEEEINPFGDKWEQ